MKRKVILVVDKDLQFDMGTIDVPNSQIENILDSLKCEFLFNNYIPISEG